MASIVIAPLPACYNMVLVAEVGRAPTLGRPALFATTGDLVQFGLTSLSDLPEVKERKRAETSAAHTEASTPVLRGITLSLPVHTKYKIQNKEDTPMCIGRHKHKPIQAAKRLLQIAQEIGCEAIQIFASNPTAWQPPGRRWLPAWLLHKQRKSASLIR